ncbi:MFS transporter [Planotetraspora sp. A-T 1434]|uniref:MFS transporter n=1 Tax=Planotetraspora sp. A-T 1434 TaxID=2979219 RepID=UPI0021C0C861|nr:MFS transporter [Planotetraspora sp. A-T 1434]MCT9934493.1 MFS transporter [Planotetraspora sp. A-T 1434]
MDADGDALMWHRFRSFDRSVQLLMLNQFAINTGFYMLMPYLAGHLAHGLGMATWTVALVLAMRNLSQQGLFLLGGALADRLGYRPVIIVGCLLRTCGFALLGFAATLPALLVASAMTGLAGALFNPAVRAYLAHDAKDRRVEGFALFNVFYQAGILAGPLIGVALMTTGFPLVCWAAAAVFALLTVLQLLALPSCHSTTDGPTGLLAGWRIVVKNRPFLLFTLAMSTSYVLAFQIYLALPLHLGSTGGVSALFVVSAVVAIGGQLRITVWARTRWSSGQAITRGLALMALAFLPLAITSWTGTGCCDGMRLTAVLTCTVMLALGSALTYPFEMDTVVLLARERLVATHYGLYNTVAGIGITLGNVLIGTLLGSSVRPAPWLLLAAAGTSGAIAVHFLTRGGHATDALPSEALTASQPKPEEPRPDTSAAKSDGIAGLTTPLGARAAGDRPR